MRFSGTERGDRDASEYHPNHFHVEREGSKTHPVGPPAASYQHTVLKPQGGTPIDGSTRMLGWLG